jgi:hypothetical protein
MQIALSLVFIVVISFVLVADSSATDVRGSAVKGNVVGKDGRPLSGIKVLAMLQSGEYKEGYDWLEAKTDSNGTFTIKGLYPGTYYRIAFDGEHCNDQRARIRSLPGGETLSLDKDYILFFSPFKVSSDGVIKDPRTGLEWAPVPLMTVTYDRAVTYVKSLRLAGGGWRLPTVNELKDLHESGQSGCGLDRAFGNIYPKAWSSDPKSPSKQWIVEFSRDKACAQLWDQRSVACDDCRVMPVRPSKRYQ